MTSRTDSQLCCQNEVVFLPAHPSLHHCQCRFVSSYLAYQLLSMRSCVMSGISEMPFSKACSSFKPSLSLILILLPKCLPVAVFSILYLTSLCSQEFHNVTLDKSGDPLHWMWDSDLPLECMSHSVRIRSKAEASKIWSEWSPWKTVLGKQNKTLQYCYWCGVFCVVQGGRLVGLFCCFFAVQNQIVIHQ